MRVRQPMIAYVKKLQKSLAIFIPKKYIKTRLARQDQAGSYVGVTVNYDKQGRSKEWDFEIANLH